MDIAYGMKPKPEDDPFIACSERAVAGVVRAFVPGAFFVVTAFMIFSSQADVT